MIIMIIIILMSCNDNEIQCGLGLLLKDKSTGNHINCSFKNPFK